MSTSLTIFWVVLFVFFIPSSICCCTYFCCIKRRRRNQQQQRFKSYVYKSNNFPNSRRERVKILTYSGRNAIDECLLLLKSCFAWMRVHCPCSFNFTDSISLSEAISRYQEIPPESKEEFMKSLRENVYVHVILSYINQKLPKFYFRILPSGSLRERFGSKLPSTSVLATDYDLMLVPDGIYVYDKDTKHQRDFPATFVAIDDPNENPNTPQGFLWLLLQESKLKEWKKLCYEKLMQGGVELLLSQLAVLNMVREVIGNDSFLTALKYVVCPSDTAKVNYSVEAFRSGPALTIIVKKKTSETGATATTEEGQDVFHVDFTLAISCPVFPQCAKDFFERRASLDRGPVHWPSNEIVRKIETLGCHVVPKPSKKELVQYKTEENEKSYLNQGAVLEWRYSFSQAEMLLADEIPEPARAAFIAFKAVIKTHVNNAVDRIIYKFHDISSYVLKTILFYEVEKLPAEFWKEDEVECKFFVQLMDVLYKCLQVKRCDHYWIPKINLLEDKLDDDFVFFIQRLNAIRLNYEKHLTSDWLEFQRCIRLHCCTSCVMYGRDYKQLTGLEKIPWIEDGTCCTCCTCNFSYDSNAWKLQVHRDQIPPWTLNCTRRHGPIAYNPELFEVY